LKFRQDAKLDPAWVLRLVQSRGDLTLLPPAVLRLDLSRPAAASDDAASRLSRPLGAGRLRPRSTPVAAASPAAVGEGAAGSWWTARATAGEVKTGFTREAMTAETPPDPGAPGGLFERVGQVLTHLTQGLVG
jgi:hypothetical protein